MELKLTASVFKAAASDGTELKFDSALQPLTLVQKVPASVTPSFSTTDEEVFQKLSSGELSLKLSITLSGQTAVYTMNFGNLTQTVEKSEPNLKGGIEDGTDPSWILKSVGAATLAVAAVGLLGGCEGGEMVGNANGLNDTAELKGIKMTVRSLAYASYSDGTFYLVPEVLINNGSAAGIPLNPTGGSFKLRVNGSKELDINSDTMAILDKNAELNALDTRTLNRGQYEKGHLCGKGSGVSKFDYVQVLFYPNPQDAKTYLCCKIAAKEASLMLGI